MSDIIRELEKEQLRTDLPKLEVGDTVRVFVKVVEGSRERLQNFEGVVIKMQGGGVRKTFTVRRVSYGVGVERTFPYNSPRIGRIEVVRHGKVRRAKLYYLRDRVGKAAKVVELMLREIDSVKKDGITKEEFARSKQQLKGNYLLGLESTASRSSSLGRGELRGRIYTDEELIRRIEGVTMESVEAVIPKVLDTERMAGAFVGRVNKRETEVKRIFETA